VQALLARRHDAAPSTPCASGSQARDPEACRRSARSRARRASRSATGHYRNGILLAPLTAEIVTASVLDGRVDEMSGAVVSPDRFL
jgi:glycine/D-amino acid oxidase-like deaminating enzyme